MQNWLFRETRNFAKQPVSFPKQQNSFRIEFRETKSETSFAGNPIQHRVDSVRMWQSAKSTHICKYLCEIKTKFKNI
jgi:hypothetical protein